MYIRAIPFVLFVFLTALQGELKNQGPFILYTAKTVLGIGLILSMKPFVSEMRWNISWEAVLVGVVVFVIWVGIDPYYPQWGLGKGFWNPQAELGEKSPLAWFYMIARILGMTFVVPPLEEVFYRSFLYRFISMQDFEKVPMSRFLPIPMLAGAAIFGFSHTQWLAGILCGLAYQGLVLRKNRLGDAITAHAFTNFLLGCYVVWKGAWQFF